MQFSSARINISSLHRFPLINEILLKCTPASLLDNLGHHMYITRLSSIYRTRLGILYRFVRYIRRISSANDRNVNCSLYFPNIPNKHESNRPLFCACSSRTKHFGIFACMVRDEHEQNKLNKLEPALFDKSSPDQ